jgi:hypothetical protein
METQWGDLHVGVAGAWFLTKRDGIQNETGGTKSMTPVSHKSPRNLSKQMSLPEAILGAELKKLGYRFFSTV